MKTRIGLITLVWCLWIGYSAGSSEPVQSADQVPAKFEFQFKKGLWPDTYYLLIDNKDKKRTVEFYNCYLTSSDDSNCYLEMSNGSKINFDSNIFKGLYWVSPGERGEISFKIDKKLVDEAERVIIKGAIYVPVWEVEAVESKDDHRELVVTFDVFRKRVTYHIGDKISQKIFIADFAKSKYKPIGEGDLWDDRSPQDYRLINGLKEGDPLSLQK